MHSMTSSNAEPAQRRRSNDEEEASNSMSAECLSRRSEQSSCSLDIIDTAMILTQVSRFNAAFLPVVLKRVDEVDDKIDAKNMPCALPVPEEDNVTLDFFVRMRPVYKTLLSRSETALCWARLCGSSSYSKRIAAFTESHERQRQEGTNKEFLIRNKINSLRQKCENANAFITEFGSKVSLHGDSAGVRKYCHFLQLARSSDRDMRKWEHKIKRLEERAERLEEETQENLYNLTTSIIDLRSKKAQYESKLINEARQVECVAHGIITSIDDLLQDFGVDVCRFYEEDLTINNKLVLSRVDSVDDVFSEADKKDCAAFYDYQKLIDALDMIVKVEDIDSSESSSVYEYSSDSFSDDESDSEKSTGH